MKLKYINQEAKKWLKDKQPTIISVQNLTLICDNCKEQFTSFDNRFIILSIDNQECIKLGLVAIDEDEICECMLNDFKSSDSTFPVIKVPFTTPS